MRVRVLSAIVKLSKNLRYCVPSGHLLRTSILILPVLSLTRLIPMGPPFTGSSVQVRIPLGQLVDEPIQVFKTEDPTLA